MDISVIIVNYNTYEHTKRCIESVLSALDSFPSIQGEIILIDNHSEDGSAQKIQEEFEQEDRLNIIFNSENSGFSKANNIGMEQAKGDYLLLLNSDTVIQSDTLKVSLDYLNNHKDYALLGCKVVLPSGKLDAACKRSFPTPLSGLFHSLKLDKIFPRNPYFGEYNLTYLDEDTTSEVDCIMGAFMLVRRDAYEDVGGLDEDYFMYGEDIDWCYRFKEKGYKIVYHPATSITHFKKASWTGKRNPKVLDAFYDSMLIFYDKHYQDKYNPFTTGVVKFGTKTLKRLANLKNNLKK